MEGLGEFSHLERAWKLHTLSPYLALSYFICRNSHCAFNFFQVFAIIVLNEIFMSETVTIFQIISAGVE